MMFIFSPDNCDWKDIPVLNKMERVDESFVVGKLNRFLLAYHPCSIPGYGFAEAPIKILMFY